LSSIPKETAGIALFRQGEPIKMNNDNITRVKLDPKNVSHGNTDWEKVEAMTEEDINKAAEADSDCLPLSQQELNEFRRISIQVPIL
jgi:hypothetical protein